MNVGDKVLASDFNSLFNRLEDVRKKHYRAPMQNASANSTLATSFSYRVTTGNKVMASDVTKLRSNVQSLTTSTWIDSTFTSKIRIPSIGELIKASTYNELSNIISDIENICPHYTQYGNTYGQYVQGYNQYNQAYGQYGQAYNQYTQTYGQYQQYSQYGQGNAIYN